MTDIPFDRRHANDQAIRDLATTLSDLRDSIHSQLELIIEAQKGTNQQLATMNGRMGRLEQWREDTERVIRTLVAAANVRRGLLLPVVWSVKVGQREIVRLAIAGAVGAAGGAQLQAAVELVRGWLGG